jgi:hypothetical protein
LVTFYFPATPMHVRQAWVDFLIYKGRKWIFSEVWKKFQSDVTSQNRRIDYFCVQFGSSLDG